MTFLAFLGLYPDARRRKYVSDALRLRPARHITKTLARGFRKAIR
jgi:hypothetical protein